MATPAQARYLEAFHRQCEAVAAIYKDPGDGSQYRADLDRAVKDMRAAEGEMTREEKRAIFGQHASTEIKAFFI